MAIVLLVCDSDNTTHILYILCIEDHDAYIVTR